MKITSFNPLIVSADAASATKLFEELGFEKTHSKDSVNNDLNYTAVRMKDPNGFHVDITQSQVLHKDMTIIRMNVDDLEEAVDLLEKHGFVNGNSGQQVETSSSKSQFMVSPSGFAINVVKHIRK